MIINAKPDGEVLAEGNSGEVAGTAYDGQVPDDFRATYALGKYRFIDGAIVKNPDFVMPAPEQRDDPA